MQCICEKDGRRGGWGYGGESYLALEPVNASLEVCLLMLSLYKEHVTKREYETLRHCVPPSGA